MKNLDAVIASIRKRVEEMVPDEPVAQIPQLTKEESWSHRLRDLDVPPYYRDRVPFGGALPAELSGWTFDPWAITLLGETGCGKTFTAIRLLELFERSIFDNRFDKMNPRRLGAFADVSLSIEKIKSEFGTDRQGDTMNRLSNIGILLLDDLGAERGTPFQEEQVSLILRSRYNNDLPTIITSNAVKISDAVEARMASRLQAGVFPMKGKDRRLK